MTKTNSYAYVRTDMLPQAAPPVSTSGPIAWARENLFSGVLNSILTILSLLIITSFITSLYPWLIGRSVVDASSLTQCREVLATMEPRGSRQFSDIWALIFTFNGEVFGSIFTLDPVRLLKSPVTAWQAFGHALNEVPHANGSCFAVIKDRYTQLFYGFYPSHLYGRANLALALMFVAVAPVLFDRLPRKMLILSILYPFILYWLVWGGSIWGPVSIIMGFVVLVLAASYVETIGNVIVNAVRRGMGRAVDPSKSYVGSLAVLLLSVIAAFVWWIYAAAPFEDFMHGHLEIQIESVESKYIGGFMISLIIGVTGIVLSLPLGILLALGRQSDLFIVKTICVGFIEFIRGVPLIALLFTASLLLNYFLPKGTSFDVVLRVVIMVTLFAAAYMAEVIRGGLAALPTGQYEAADSLGLDYWKAQRLIIMPQALKIAIPGIVNTFIGLFKDTTLVSFIGIFDMLGFAGAIRASTDWNGIYWELFIFIGAVFFVVCYSMSRYSQWLERKLRTDHH